MCAVGDFEMAGDEPSLCFALSSTTVIDLFVFVFFSFMLPGDGNTRPLHGRVRGIFEATTSEYEGHF